jgi:hypothetical protein
MYIHTCRDINTARDTLNTCTNLLPQVEVQPSLLQHREVLDEQPAVLDALALPQLRAQLELRCLVEEERRRREW